MALGNYGGPHPYSQQSLIFKDTGDGKTEPYGMLKLVNASWNKDTEILNFTYDEKVLPKSAFYKTDKSYELFPEGTFNIVVERPLGEPVNIDPVSITMTAGEYATLIAIGSGAELKLVKYNDDLSPPDDKTANVRVVHAVPAGPAVDIVDVTNNNSLNLFENLTFDPDPIVDTFSPLEADITGTYDIDVLENLEPNNLVASKRDLTLIEGDIYTFLVVGTLDLPNQITLEVIKHVKKE